MVDAVSGNITLNGTLDRETVSSYSIGAFATDQGDPAMSNSSRVVITVTDVNDEDPIATIVLNETIYEHSANGTIIGTVEAVDRDAGVNGTIQFTITAGADYVDILEDVD